MKLVLFAGICLTCSLMTGCASINTMDRESYNALMTYRQKIGSKFNDYLENDAKMSSREKNTYKSYERMYDRTLSNIEIED